MIRMIKKNIIVILVCFILGAGCISCIRDKAEDKDSTKSYLAVFEDSKLRVPLDIYGTKFFYMEIENATANFYLYDFSDGKIEEVENVQKFALQGRSNVRIGSALYFYLSVYEEDDLENVLYVMDYEKKEMRVVCKNSYAKKLIPLIEMDGKLLALQGDVLGDGSINSFIEIVNEDGSVQLLTLQQDKLPLDSGDSRHIIYFDGNDQSLYSVESVTSDGSVRYYFAVYNQDFICTEVVEITDILRSYGINNNIGFFYVFGDFFCVADYSCNTIVCEKKDGKGNVILSGSNLEYAVNSCRGMDYEFFYVRNTNSIYRLNTKSGEMEMQNYHLENDISVIRYALSGEGNLLVVKRLIADNLKEERIYFIPYGTP